MLIFSFIILISTIISRIYDSIYKIERKIFYNMHKIPINFSINGTNGYSYYFKSDDILFNFDNIFLNDIQKVIRMFDQNIKILFNLSIYEYNNEFFDFSSNDIIYSEIINVDINFKLLTFYKEYDDFSFGFKYDIDDLDKNILIHFENIDKLNIFKFLLFEEKNDIYNQSTLLNFIKKNLLLNFDKEIKKSLAYYPENDSLFYFKSIIDYFKKEEFSLYLDIDLTLTINFCKITSFKYDQIIKNNRTIFLKNINTTMYLEADYHNIDGQGNDYSSKDFVTIIIDFISIDENKKITFFREDKDKEYAFDALKLVVNKTEKILENEEI